MSHKADKADRFPEKVYEKELRRLQVELVKMQRWVRAEGKRVVVIFEGRDAAGKGGAISRVSQYLNPRAARRVGLVQRRGKRATAAMQIVSAALLTLRPRR